MQETSSALVQEDKEVRDREQRVPMVQKGYVVPNGGQHMMYAPQDQKPSMGMP